MPAPMYGLPTQARVPINVRPADVRRYLEVAAGSFPGAMFDPQIFSNHVIYRHPDVARGPPLERATINAIVDFSYDLPIADTFRGFISIVADKGKIRKVEDEHEAIHAVRVTNATADNRQQSGLASAFYTTALACGHDILEDFIGPENGNQIAEHTLSQIENALGSFTSPTNKAQFKRLVAYGAVNPELARYISDAITRYAAPSNTRPINFAEVAFYMNAALVSRDASETPDQFMYRAFSGSCDDHMQKCLEYAALELPAMIDAMLAVPTVKIEDGIDNTDHLRGMTPQATAARRTKNTEAIKQGKRLIEEVYPHHAILGQSAAQPDIALLEKRIILLEDLTSQI